MEKLAIGTEAVQDVEPLSTQGAQGPGPGLQHPGWPSQPQGSPWPLPLPQAWWQTGTPSYLPTGGWGHLGYTGLRDRRPLGSGGLSLYLRM